MASFPPPRINNEFNDIPNLEVIEIKTQAIETNMTYVVGFTFLKKKNKANTLTILKSIKYDIGLK